MFCAWQNLLQSKASLRTLLVRSVWVFITAGSSASCSS